MLPSKLVFKLKHNIRLKKGKLNSVLDISCGLWWTAMSISQKTNLFLEQCFLFFFNSNSVPVGLHSTTSWFLVWWYRLDSHCRCHINWSQPLFNSFCYADEILSSSPGENWAVCLVAPQSATLSESRWCWLSPTSIVFTRHSVSFCLFWLSSCFCLVYIQIIALFSNMHF